MRRRILLTTAFLLPGLLASGAAWAQAPGATSAPLPPLPPLPNIPLPRGIALLEPGAWRVEFPHGGEVLEAPQRVVLARIGAALSAGTEGRITLIAEVSEGDDLSTTRRLSLVRARAVRAALVAGGLAETRIDVRAMGRTAAIRDSVDVLAPIVPKP